MRNPSGTTKGKVKSTGNMGITFAKGGSGHMYGAQGADPMVPGQTAASAGKGGGKFAVGGKGKMFGYTGSSASKPGVTK